MAHLLPLTPVLLLPRVALLLGTWSHALTLLALSAGRLALAALLCKLIDKAPWSKLVGLARPVVDEVERILL